MTTIAPAVVAVIGTLSGVIVTTWASIVLDRRRRRQAELQNEIDLAEKRRDEKRLVYANYLTKLAEVGDVTETHKGYGPDARDTRRLRQIMRPVRSALILVAPPAIVSETIVHRDALARWEVHREVLDRGHRDRDWPKLHEFIVSLRSARIEQLMAMDLQGVASSELEKLQPVLLADELSMRLSELTAMDGDLPTSRSLSAGGTPREPD